MVDANPYDCFLDIAVAASALLFVLSLYMAYRLRRGSHTGSLSEKQIRLRGYLLVGLWVIIPPIWFFFEFQFLHPNMIGHAEELARVKHAQELGRNVWLAFTVVLAAIVGIKWSPGA